MPIDQQPSADLTSAEKSLDILFSSEQKPLSGDRAPQLSWPRLEALLTS
jgi:hypothetical protein